MRGSRRVAFFATICACAVGLVPAASTASADTTEIVLNAAPDTPPPPQHLYPTVEEVQAQRAASSASTSTATRGASALATSLQPQLTYSGGTDGIGVTTGP